MKYENVLVSIIMPTYNHAHFINEAIDSVINQTYKNWELIIINNYSTDNTLETIFKYTDARIFIKNYANEGIIARSRNEGMKIARGKYIAFLDSDDTWDPAKLEKQLAIFSSKGDLLLCSTALVIFPKNIRAPLFRIGNRRLSLAGILKTNTIYNSSVMMDRSCIETIGFFNESKNLITIEDYEYWLRVLLYKDKSVFFIDTPLVHYRVSQSNASGFGKQLNPIKEMGKYEECANIFPSNSLAGRFLKMKKSEICRRLIEFGTDENIKQMYFKDILIEDRIRMYFARIVKRFIKAMNAHHKN